MPLSLRSNDPRPATGRESKTVRHMPLGTKISLALVLGLLLTLTLCSGAFGSVPAYNKKVVFTSLVLPGAHTFEISRAGTGGPAS
jgi:hypothetical protein